MEFLPILLAVGNMRQRRRERNAMRIRRRKLRDISNPFEISDLRFVELFRIPKFLTLHLIEIISPFLENSIRQSKIPKHMRMLATLRFYGTGSYQRSVGQDFFNVMSQTVISRSVNEVSLAISNNLSLHWIKFPTTRQEVNASKIRFMQMYNFPGVIGAIDCTHVSITNPGQNISHAYLDRHDNFSKNVQIICDADLKIININARYAGATHDAFIWRASNIQEHLRRNFEQGDNTTWLLGDSGYPLQPYLMTPVANAPNNSPHERYNKVHCKARSCIERVNGILKERFRCISGDRVLKYSPAKAGAIIISCATLHNILIHNRINFDNEILPVNEPPYNNGLPEEVDLYNQGRLVREQLIATHFENL